MDTISDVPHHQGYLTRKTGKEVFSVDHEVVIPDGHCTMETAPFTGMLGGLPRAFCNCLHESMPLRVCQTHPDELGGKTKVPEIPVRPYLEDVKYISRINTRDIRAL